MTKPESFVDLPGIVKVIWKSEDPTFHKDPEDLQNLQKYPIAESFCKKDKITRVQAFFQCDLCEVTLCSVASLRNHVFCSSHVIKATTEASRRKRKASSSHGSTVSSKRSRRTAETLSEVHLLQKKSNLTGSKFLVEFAGTTPYLYCCRLCHVFAKSELMYDHLSKSRKHKALYFKETYGTEMGNPKELDEESELEFRALGFDLELMEKSLDLSDYRQVHLKINQENGVKEEPHPDEIENVITEIIID